MRIKIIAIGAKMPVWVQIACNEYLKRIPNELNVNIIEIPMKQRGKGVNPHLAVIQEGEAMLKAIRANDRVIALDLRGKNWKTQELARNIQEWKQSGDDYSLLIGGPDGFSRNCIKRADILWSLSPLTFPHPLVRILLVEQIYRASTINNGHPYHR
jgi:23S rRNA (pseudouridine1915-N3)-methyltransferase|tara:strand:- start:3636 stop:4103 length:468 start_codon:yes stop_codon:yes gene_type:complete